MGLIFCVFLCILGILGASPLLSEKVPAARSGINALLKYQEIFGVIGIIIGIISLFTWLTSLYYLIHFPLRMLIALAALLLELGLGLIFGLSLLRRNVLKDPSSQLLINLETARSRIVGRQNEMGIAAMVVSLYFLIHLI